MRVAILSNQANSFVKPMAEGLHRMFSRIGVQSRIFTLGLRMMEQRVWRPGWRRRTRLFAMKTLLWPYLASLAPYDVIVVVLNLPNAFLRGNGNIEVLRRLFPRKVIVNYDLHYLATRPPNWLEWLRHGGADEFGIPAGGHFGLERYDWYLLGSVVSEQELPPGEQPYSLIGVDLADGTLYPEKDRDFLVLVDFERPKHMPERAVQIQALEAAGTPYRVLNGRFSIADIRAIYRRTSAYLVAHRESFGLPIAEIQACGGKIITPYASWCPSHWLKDDLRQAGEGEHSPNFFVYDNDSDKLVEALRRLRAEDDPQRNLEIFKKYHPQLLHGDTEQLRAFVDRVERGEITSRSHSGYADIQPVPYAGQKDPRWH